jgi:hypothetical protein
MVSRRWKPDENRPYEGEDAVNQPTHFADRPSNHHCPHCDRRVKYLSQDRCWWCVACGCELDAEDVGDY